MKDINNKQVITDEELLTQEVVDTSSTKSCYLKGGKRLLGAFLNMLVILVLGLLLDKFVISPIMKDVTSYSSVVTQFETYNKEYKSIQDKYGIFIYDEYSNREENDSITEEMSKDFFNDPRIQFLIPEMNKLQNELLKVDISILVVDYLVSSLIYSLFGNFLFGIGRSFAGILLHYQLVDTSDNKLKVSKVFIYSLLKWLFNGVIGVITLGIYPLYNFYSLTHDDEYRSPLDKLIGVKYKVDEKFTSD